MSSCDGNCSSCSASCEQRDPKSLLVEPNPRSNVKKVIGIVSGKGGVGKSMVTSLLASGMKKRNHTVGILDADITGPSIPKIFGVGGYLEANEFGGIPKRSEGGIDLVSINFLVEDVTQPVVWRGPVIAGAVQQFWTDIIWEDDEYLFIDMPPGTGDVPLTVFQSIPVDGIIIVTSPQELVSMIVEKAVYMASMMNIKVLGIVENMSYITCPDCGRKINVFGDSHVDEIAAKHSLEVLAKIPMDPKIAENSDSGNIEHFTNSYVDGVLDRLEEME